MNVDCPRQEVVIGGVEDGLVARWCQILRDGGDLAVRHANVSCPPVGEGGGGDEHLLGGVGGVVVSGLDSAMFS